MAWIDARLPVRFGRLDSRGEHEALLTDAPTPPPATRFIVGPGGHLPDCACCTPRSAAASALAQLFRDRAVALGPAIRGVLAVVGPDGEAAIRAAMTDDALVAARFRLA